MLEVRLKNSVNSRKNRPAHLQKKTLLMIEMQKIYVFFEAKVKQNRGNDKKGVRKWHQK
jgi:hypothetical protein